MTTISRKLVDDHVSKIKRELSDIFYITRGEGHVIIDTSFFNTAVRNELDGNCTHLTIPEIWAIEKGTRTSFLELLDDGFSAPIPILAEFYRGYERVKSLAHDPLDALRYWWDRDLSGKDVRSINENAEGRRAARRELRGFLDETLTLYHALSALPSEAYTVEGTKNNHDSVGRAVRDIASHKHITKKLSKYLGGRSGMKAHSGNDATLLTYAVANSAGVVCSNDGGVIKLRRKIYSNRERLIREHGMPDTNHRVSMIGFEKGRYKVFA